jgi:hypothetical protein
MIRLLLPNVDSHLDIQRKRLTSISIVEFIFVTISKIIRVRLLSWTLKQGKERSKYGPTSISSYVMASQTPASNSSNDFQVNFG